MSASGNLPPSFPSGSPSSMSQSPRPSSVPGPPPSEISAPRSVNSPPPLSNVDSGSSNSTTLIITSGVIIVILLIGFFVFLNKKDTTVTDAREKAKFQEFGSISELTSQVDVKIDQVTNLQLSASAEEKQALFDIFAEGLNVQLLLENQKMKINVFGKKQDVEWVTAPTIEGMYTILDVDPKIGGAVEIILSPGLLITLDDVTKKREAEKSYVFKNLQKDELIRAEDYDTLFGETKDARIRRKRAQKTARLDSYFRNLVKNFEPTPFLKKTTAVGKKIKVNANRTIEIEGDVFSVSWKGNAPTAGAYKIQSVAQNADGKDHVGADVEIHSDPATTPATSFVFLNFQKPRSADLSGVSKEFPDNWGDPPVIEAKGSVSLPGGYGTGSSTLAAWITGNMQRDAGDEAVKQSLIDKEMERECPIPDKWCDAQDGHYYRHLDCNGNGMRDHMCFMPNSDVKSKVIFKKFKRAIESTMQGDQITIRKNKLNVIEVKKGQASAVSKSVKWEGNPPSLSQDLSGTIDSVSDETFTLTSGEVLSNPLLLKQNGAVILDCIASEDDTNMNCNNSEAASLASSWQDNQQVLNEVLLETPCPRPSSFCMNTGDQYTFTSCDGSGKSYHVCRTTRKAADNTEEVIFQRLERDTADPSTCKTTESSNIASFCPSMFSCKSERSADNGKCSSKFDNDSILCTHCGTYLNDSLCDGDPSCTWIGQKPTYCNDCLASDGISSVCKPEKGVSACFDDDPASFCAGCTTRDAVIPEPTGEDITYSRNNAGFNFDALFWSWGFYESSSENQPSITASESDTTESDTTAIYASAPTAAGCYIYLPKGCELNPNVLIGNQNSVVGWNTSPINPLITTTKQGCDNEVSRIESECQTNGALSQFNGSSLGTSAGRDSIGTGAGGLNPIP